MTPSEQKKAAQEFVARWKDRGDEKQDTQAFWLDFLAHVFDVKNPGEICQFEYRVKTVVSDHTGFADLWIEPARLLVEQKSSSVDLAEKELRQGRMVTPGEQARDYANGIPLSQRPRYIMACNFKEFWFYDLNLDAQCKTPYLKVSLEQLPNNLAAFAMLEGGEKAQAVLTREVSVQAGKIMGNLHRFAAEAYEKAGADPDDPAIHHALAVLLTRIMFLLFCEDSGIIETDAFKDYLMAFKAENYQTALQDLFVWLDTKDEDRSPFASEGLKRFPYMNGGLYREKIFLPPLGIDFAECLIVQAAQGFNWAGVSPTVFGSIFEGALSHNHRRANGQHFTSVENIHKVLDPLFLDELEDEFEEACRRPVAGGSRTNALRRLNDKLGCISILDPAAGSGNFLTEAYMSLRRLENRIFIEVQRDPNAWQAYIPDIDDGGGHNLDVTVSLANFYGIEVEDYACCVARTALWIAEQQANIATQRITGRPYKALPLNDYEGVVCANALHIDWNDVVPSERVSYVCGNPPFVGHQWRTPSQQKDMAEVFGKLRGAGKLDYVCAWFKKAADYTQASHAQCAFVATNSICQGESVGVLWKELFSEGIHIDFAWTSFVWNSQSSDEAHVHVVIVGFGREKSKVKLLFGPDGARVASNINGYLADAPNVFIANRGNPLHHSPALTKGSQATDWGHLIITANEREALIDAHPDLDKVIRPYMGSREFLNGGIRYCLWFYGSDIANYQYPEIKERLMDVKMERMGSSTASVREAADTPWLFTQIRQPDSNYLALPRVSSGRRKYIPIGFIDSEVIASDGVVITDGADLFLFGLLSSQFHAAWMRVVVGRLKSDYRYSPAVYNSFVFPDCDQAAKADIELCASEVIEARSSYADKSLAQLYDPDDEIFFGRLYAAHSALDAAVESAYGVDFGGDEEKIVSHLFQLYAKAVGNGR